MKRERLNYILSEIKTILLFAVCIANLATWLSVGWWWYKPVGFGLAVLAGSFTIAVLLGIFASLHDDYRLSVQVERRHK